MEYFDFNATAPLCDPAREVWIKVVSDFSGNPSSLHRVGRRAEHKLEESRECVAAILGCQAGEVIWTSGATESNNLVFHHLWRTLPSESSVWISAIEHPCVKKAALHYFGDRVEWIPVNSLGVVEMETIRLMVSHKPLPGCIAVMAANNETGMLQPWQDIASLCRELGILFHCDAAQWCGKMPSMGLGQCDFVSGASHKFSGPKGVGFLKLPVGCGWVPLILGGGQEDGRRAGTENVAGIVAMAAALDYRNRQVNESFLADRQAWKNEFIQRLLSRVTGAKLVGDTASALWNTAMVCMPETDCRQRWVVKMDKAGFAVSSGSACSSGEEKPSAVLTAMGYTASESGRALRFSSGWETQREDWDRLIWGVAGVHELLIADGPQTRASAEESDILPDMA